jgi:ubiquinone/menaquinone biosynthesis C-methylase UbiE
MPTLAQNLEQWDDQRNWGDQGDAWSYEFGGTEALWWFMLYPRIHRFLPASVILEIAPGHGRWTQFLQHLCESMVAVDISEKCIEHCKRRFAGSNHIRFYANDGSSLAEVPDDSVDFVFSFDSLVHVESDVVEAYVAQLAKKLKRDGVGFLHHSNMGSYRGRLAILDRYRRLPLRFRSRILKENHMEWLLSINSQGWRASSMTAKLFREYCGRAGLKCIGQELINWHRGRCLIDAISVFTKPGSRWDRQSVCVENDKFVESAALTARLAQLYSR